MTESAPGPATTWVEQAGALTLDELSRSCGAQVEWLVELVQEGVLEPEGDAPPNWRFTGSSLRRARVAWRLTRDLQLNAAGAALALDLLDEIHTLRLRTQTGRRG